MKRVLCATDLSEASDEAIRQADAVARQEGAALALCHVVPDVQRIHALFPQRHLAEALAAPDAERLARDALLERARALTGRGPNEVEAFVELGSGYAEILVRAESWKADLVVAASHGRTGLARVLLGSVATQLVRHAHCPVLIARASAERGIVLAATDLSDASLPAVKAAAAEATRRGATLLVLHVLDLVGPSAFISLGSPFGMASTSPSEETIRAVHSAARVTLESALAGLGASGEIEVADGEAAATILRVADERRAELVVVGTRGRSGLARVALGSVAERVVQLAACSVLAVRLTAA